MQTILPTEFRGGMAVIMGGVPHIIEEYRTIGTAKTRHRLHVRLRNLQTGKPMEHTFVENERVTVADVKYRNVQFSYKQGDRFVFMDGRTFEELSLTEDQVGERAAFLNEDDEYKAIFVEGQFTDITIPDNVPLRVLETAPPQRSSQQSTLKPAVLEGGLEVQVPMFISQGETIRVDTRTKKYLCKEG